MTNLMRSIRRTSSLLALGLLTAATAGAAGRLADVAPLPGVPKTTFTHPGGSSIHIKPTVQLQDRINKARQSALAGRRSLSNVTYHGGRIMQTVNIYAIFWAPPTLQSGAPTSMPGSYRTVLVNMMKNYAGHSIANINTQYSEVVSGVTRYHTGLGRLAAAVLDTAPYPASGCTDSATPGACLTDAQIQAKIESVRLAHGWGTGFDKIYVLFTSSGEGSCFDASGTSCAYTQYCAYHGFYGSAASPVIYSNEPYGNNSVCQSTASLPNPGTADSAATAARHEISEATTDPMLNAWFDPVSGEETSDKCNFNYGTRTWDGGLANYFWGGKFFLLQEEYSNHKSNCTQEGP